MVETTRLKIFPLKYDQVLKYIENKNELEKELGLVESNWLLSEHLIKMLRMKMLPVLKQKCDAVDCEVENFMYNTIWLVVDKSLNAIVADFGVKGEPNSEGEIEIGYGTHAPFQNKGYITEAIGSFVSWEMHKAEVKFIIAETDNDNISSIRVLEKNNFEVYRTSDKSKWWRRLVN